MKTILIKHVYQFDIKETNFIFNSYNNEDKETIKKAISELKEIIHKNYLCMCNRMTYTYNYKKDAFKYRIQMKLLKQALKQ